VLNAEKSTLLDTLVELNVVFIAGVFFGDKQRNLHYSKSEAVIITPTRPVKTNWDFTIILQAITPACLNTSFPH
jgi:hypothetical protein